MNYTRSKLGPKDLRSSMALLLKARKIPMLWGSPGLGKTAIVNQLAKENKHEVIVFSTVMNEPQDLLGLPDIFRDPTNPENNKAGYTPMDIFPLDSDPLPEGKKGWIIFIDELPSGGTEMQAACLKMMQERIVGNRKLHPNVSLIAAGNYATDRVHSNDIITAMGSRVVHLHCGVSSDEWLEYAQKNDHDWRVMAFIHEHPDALHVFDPNSVDPTFRCYRTWSDLSDILKHVPELKESHRPVVEGTIGVEGASQFMTFARMADRLPKRNDIINDPDSIPVDKDDVALSYMLAYLLMDIAKKHHFKKFLKLFNKFSREFQFMIFRGWALNPGPAGSTEIYSCEELSEWVQEALKIQQA